MCFNQYFKVSQLLHADWIAPNATVIGDIKLAEGCSLWHSVIVTGNRAAVSIGKNSSVQDCSRIASRHRSNEDQVKIGFNVSVGANVNLDVYVLEDNTFVGMGSTINKGVMYSNLQLSLLAL